VLSINRDTLAGEILAIPPEAARIFNSVADFLVPFMIGVALFAAYELTLRRRKK
jgi:hypothetical protein